MYKKYYKKRRYYNNKKENDLISSMFLLFFLGGFGIYWNYIKPNIEYITKILKIGLIFIGLLIFLAVLYFIYSKFKEIKEEKERIANIPKFLKDLENKIKEFKPIRQYKEERLYQTELVGFLKNNYPNLKIEETKDYSRPDIIIDNIAIEVKGPTNMTGLKTLSDKINSYLPKWDYLFIVLFNIDIVYDKEENMRIYKEKKEQILENTSESKKDKVFFIEYFS